MMAIIVSCGHYVVCLRHSAPKFFQYHFLHRINCYEASRTALIAFGDDGPVENQLSPRSLMDNKAMHPSREVGYFHMANPSSRPGDRGRYA